MTAIPLENITKDISIAVHSITRGVITRNDDINMLKAQLTSTLRGADVKRSLLNERSRIVVTKALANENLRQRTEDKALKLFVQVD